MEFLDEKRFTIEIVLNDISISRINLAARLIPVSSFCFSIFGKMSVKCQVTRRNLVKIVVILLRFDSTKSPDSVPLATLIPRIFMKVIKATFDQHSLVSQDFKGSKITKHDAFPQKIASLFHKILYSQLEEASLSISRRPTEQHSK